MFALRLATDQMCAQREHAAAQVLLNSMRADLVAGRHYLSDRPAKLTNFGSLERGRKSDGPILACRSRLRR
jgi:hypothetical protein